MRLKLDENLGRAAQNIFAAAGHDVDIAVKEGLSGADDKAVFEACCREQRCLVTLDLDFADPTRFRPQDCGGIVVIRFPRRSPTGLIKGLAGETVTAMGRIALNNGLWIVEPGRIRVRQMKDE